MSFSSIFNPVVLYIYSYGSDSCKNSKPKKCGGYGNAKVRRIFIFSYYLLMIEPFCKICLQLYSRFGHLDVARVIDFIYINTDPDVFSYWTLPLK